MVLFYSDVLLELKTQKIIIKTVEYVYINELKRNKFCGQHSFGMLVGLIINGNGSFVDDLCFLQQLQRIYISVKGKVSKKKYIAILFKFGIFFQTF